MPALRLGLVGCGRIAQAVHLNILTSLPQAELVAVAEPNPELRNAASARAPRALAFADYWELLEVPEVAAVVICLPNALHSEAALAAVGAGKHIYLEKPLATTLQEGQEVLAAWRRSAIMGMIGFTYRFHALLQATQQAIQAKRLGELAGARSVFCAPIRSLPAWKQARQSGGGVLLDLASHHIDLVHYLFGEPVCEVFARLRSQRSEDDTAVLHLRLSNGLLIQSFFSLSAIDEDRFEIYGQAGKLAVDRYRSLNVEISKPTVELSLLQWVERELRSLGRNPYFLPKLWARHSEPSYQAALAHFVVAATTNQPARPDFWDGYRSLAIVVAAEESARTGRVIPVADPIYDPLAP